MPNKDCDRGLHTWVLLDTVVNGKLKTRYYECVECSLTTQKVGSA